MPVIIGVFIVVIGVLGGFLMGGGPVFVLLQVPEFVVMGAATIGSLLIGTPIWVLKRLPGKITLLLKGDPYTKDEYLNLLQTIFELFHLAGRTGLMDLESHVEHPEKSSIMMKNKFLLAHPHALHYLCDTLRLVISAGISEQEVEILLDADSETHREEMQGFPSTFSKVGDALPGLGIVAAVLGIIITMGSIGGSPESVGEHVAAALVGTFIGVLASYGFVGPIANGLEFINQSEERYMTCIKSGIIAFARGNPAVISAEIARRVIYSHVRPSFQEMDDACRSMRSVKRAETV
jgi:chemotaxis protein MotA